MHHRPSGRSTGGSPSLAMGRLRSPCGSSGLCESPSLACSPSPVSSRGGVELWGAFLVPQGPIFTNSSKASLPAGPASGDHTGVRPQCKRQGTHSSPHARAGIVCAVFGVFYQPGSTHICTWSLMTLTPFPSKGLSVMSCWSHWHKLVLEAGLVLSPVLEPTWV